MPNDKHEEEMFEITDNDNNPQIGTEILDPTMPSDLNFDDKSEEEYEGQEISSDIKYIKGDSKWKEDEIKSFRIKGKCTMEMEPKYKPASIIKQHVDTFDVKAYDEEKSGGLKSIWEVVVGYVKREICIQEGYVYILEKTKEGYLTHSALSLSSLFKIFADKEEEKIRLIFDIDSHLHTKNLGVKNCEEIINKIGEELKKMGLILIS